MPKRIDRVNSLLKQVISEVISRDVRNPKMKALISVVKVDISRDLHQAKVYVSMIGSAEDKKNSLAALQSAAGFISVNASKKVVLRYFPSLTFFLDSSVEEHIRIHELLEKIHDEKQTRSPTSDTDL